MSNQTRYAELGYRADAPNCWRIVSRDDGKSIGPQYKSKGELLADLDRYAAVYGCTKEDEQRSELATLACALAAEREKTARLLEALEGIVGLAVMTRNRRDHEGQTTLVVMCDERIDNARAAIAFAQV